MVEMESTPENAALFQASIQNIKDSHPDGAAVFVYPADEYADMKLFVNEDLTAGVAVKTDGDIVSVFAEPNQEAPGRVYSMLALAVEQGGTKLDAFDTVLPRIYGMAGFVESGRDKWNEEYMPEGWDKEHFKNFNKGEPDIVYMEYQGAKAPAFFSQSVDGESENGFTVIDNALDDGTISLTEEEAAAFVAMGYTLKDERRTQDARLNEAAARSTEETATTAEAFERAATRTDSEASAEFARARNGEPVEFLHRSQNQKVKFTDTRLGGNTGRNTAFLGHFLGAQDESNLEYGPELAIVSFTLNNPLVVTAEEFIEMGDRSIDQNKQDRLDHMAAGFDGILVEGVEYAIIFEGENIKITNDPRGDAALLAEMEREFLSQSNAEAQVLADLEALDEQYQEGDLMARDLAEELREMDDLPEALDRALGQYFADLQEDFERFGMRGDSDAYEGAFLRAFEFAVEGKVPAELQPWIGMVPENQPAEHYNYADAEKADFHHSHAVQDLDAYDADNTLRYVRLGYSDTGEMSEKSTIEVTGSPALDPYGKGRKQITAMAKDLIDKGAPPDLQIVVGDMGLDHEMEKTTIGPLSDFAKSHLSQDKEADRGRFYPDVGGKRVIQLTEASDLSTFLHESGHLFLDIQRIWADKYGMNENQHAMLEWLEADNFESLTTEQHEKWAETFEVYLREGKAPSIGLRRAFQSFASWLKRIYRSLQNPRLTRAKMDPEITEIFDKMLATQSEIDLAKLQPEYAELFQSQEQAGMTDAQWAKYKTNATRKNETAEAAVDAKVMKQYKHMKSAEWAEEKAPLIEQEAERLAKEPIYQVMSDMTAIKDDAGEVISDGRVDWHKLRDAIGEWPNGKNWIGKAVGGGVDPGLYAEAYGFASVKDMYDQVKDSDTLKQGSDKAAEAIMVEKYGDILNDGTLEQEVREAMLNEEQAAMLLAELKAEGKPAAQKIDRKMLKYQAEQLISTYTYKQIRPNKFYNQMIKAAQAAARAEDPTNDKIQQLANHYLYQAAMEAKTQMDRGRKKVRGVQSRQYNPKQVDQQYIEAMKNLATAYDMRLTPVERDAMARRVLDFYEGQTNPKNENSELFGLEMLDPNLVAAIRYRHENGTLEGFQLTTFDEMTVGELKGVTDMLDHLRYVGGQVANKGNLEAAAIREAGLESIEENGGKDSPVQRGKQRAGKMAKLTWGDLVNSIPSLGNMIRKLDGFNDGGWAFENIYKPINDAVSKKLELQQQMFKELEGFMADMSSVGLKENDAMPFTKENQEVDDFTSSEVFMMAVYWGTDSSRQALMDGHELTEGDVQQLMLRLTPRQLHLVNQVWAMNESQWPQLQEAAKAMLGIAPPKLQAASFEVNGVEMTGGHMQLMYDSQALELADEQMRGMNTANVVPMQAGSTHARTGSGGKPVLLDTRNITQSVEEKTHYIAFAEAGRHLRSILNNKEIQKKIEKKHGAPFYENMLHAITSISRAEPARETSKWLARLSRHMRGSATMMHLAYSVRNVVQQFSAIPIAAREVGVVKYAQAMGHFGSRPFEVMAMVDEKSKFMENRAQVVNREAREYMKKVMATSKGEALWNNVKSRGFILQTLVDSTVAYPTWYAKYTSSMENHGDEKRAVIEADQSVAESVGSGSDMHLGRIMQSNQNEFVKTLTVFGSWFNAYYQRLYKSSKGGTDFLSGAFLMDGLIMPIIAANLAQVLIMDIPEDEEEIPKWMAENSFKFMLGTVPLLRDISSAIDGFAPSSPISALPVAVVRAKTEVESFIKGNQSGLKMTADLGRAAGSVMPLPGSGNLWRLMDYVDSYLDGNEGKNFDLYQALTEGRDKN